MTPPLPNEKEKLDAEIQFWLNRVHAEHASHVKDKVMRMGDIAHQMHNLDCFRPEVKAEVLENLAIDMQAFGWNKERQLMLEILEKVRE